VREGYRIALVGAPNAGKSSLLNRLAGREAAIVTAMPGTTRDVIEVPAVIEGFKVLFADMAGLRESSDPIEAEGVRRARAWAEGADLRLWGVSAAASTGAWVEGSDLVRPGDILVLNKSDLPKGADATQSMALEVSLQRASVSSKTGAGLEHIWKALKIEVAQLTGGDFPAVTRIRHRRHLQEAALALRRAERGLAISPELGAEDLRCAGLALGRIAGRIDAEQVLDEVFSSFCIGK
jgi:tRNA modification GTPase